MTYFRILLGIYKESIEQIEKMCGILENTNMDDIVGYSGYIGIPNNPSNFKYSFIEKNDIIDAYGDAHKPSEFEKMLVIYGYHNFEEDKIKDWIVDYCNKNHIKISDWYVHSSEEIYG